MPVIATARKSQIEPLGFYPLRDKTPWLCVISGWVLHRDGSSACPTRTAENPLKTKAWRNRPCLLSNASRVSLMRS